MRLCGLWFGQREDEEFWHNEYSNRCVGGEWFDLGGIERECELFQYCGFSVAELRGPELRGCSVPDWCREVLAG